jgi:hypothetical protein
LGADGDGCVTPPPEGQGAAGQPASDVLPLVDAHHFARLMDEVQLIHCWHGKSCLLPQMFRFCK